MTSFNPEKRKPRKSNGSGLLKNYLTIALRSLIRNKTFSIINIFGLAIGIASTLLILIWVNYENSYNTFARNHKNIYQVRVNRSFNGSVVTEEEMCIPGYQALKTYNKITNACYTSNTYGHDIGYDGKIFGLESMEVSEEFLSMFDIPLVKGTIHSLDEPNSIMLSESRARTIFGQKDPMGQIILYNRETELKVTGIFKDVPRNSSYWFMALVPIQHSGTKDAWVSNALTDWNFFYPRVYVSIATATSLEEVNDSIKDLLKPHTKDASKPELLLQSMDRWHLYDQFENGKEAAGKFEYVRLFSWIAVLTLLIACINYINLSTAQSEKKAREVGIRKTIGSGRWTLVQQFLLESFMITAIAFGIALVLVKISLPAYSDLVGEKLELHFDSPVVWIRVVGLLVVTGLVAGGYPAFYLSSFQPVKALRGRLGAGKNGALPRTILVTAQYSFAIFLLMGMLLIYKQIDYAKNRDLGYEQDRLVMTPINPVVKKHYEALKREILQTGVIESVTRSNEGIDVDYFTDWLEWEGKSPDMIVQFSYFVTEYDYTKTHKIRILEGRDFSREFPSDSNAAIVNVAALKFLDFKHPIGKKIQSLGYHRDLTIIGVMEDVVRASPMDPVGPLYACLTPKGEDRDNYITMRLTDNHNLKQSMEKVGPIFKKYDPDVLFGYDLVRDRFLAYKFKSIELTARLAKLFTLLATFLTGLGILGLAAYMTEQRTKEFSIRKVLGARVDQLVLLMSGYFIRVALTALFITIPFTWWIGDRYLENYSYRISIPLWVAPTTAFVMLILTFFIVGLRVMRTALANPVGGLGRET